MVNLKKQLEHKRDIYERAMNVEKVHKERADKVSSAYYDGKIEVYKLIINDIDRMLLQFKNYPEDYGLKGSKTSKPTTRKIYRKTREN